MERNQLLEHALAVFIPLLLVSGAASAQLTPQQAIVEMGRGINLGNTLEPPTEGAWNNGPAQEYYFDDFKSAGFETVRIPVRWDQHTAATAPFEVSPAWMNRVEQVVDWALARDLFVIINGHHEEWLKTNYGNATLRARYDSVWSQVAVRFKDKSERLFFEIINEPFGMTVSQVDDLNARILSIIRRTNPTRIVVFSGNEWSGSAQLLAAKVPVDDYLMGYFHSYDPWDFAGLGNGTWGTQADRAAMTAQYEAVAGWSAIHNVPVMISEFGAVPGADGNSRMRYYAAVVEESLSHGVAFQVWDDGGQFEVYQRDSRTWNDIKDILIHTYPDGPTNLDATITSDSVVTLSWANRGAFISIRVERRAGQDSFAVIASLPGNATAYADSTVSGGLTYVYRVVAESGLLEDRYSYPFTLQVAPWVRSPFYGAPFVIPGTIEAEDYDIGGEGLTYHDADASNVAGAYRPNEGVDIEARSDGGCQVAYIESGEWLEYTVDIAHEGEYMITAYVASVAGGGRFGFEFGGRKSRTFTVPATGDWENLAPVSKTMSLPAGRQTMRFSVYVALPFNVDRIAIEEASATGIESPLPAKASVTAFPNPSRDRLTLAFESSPGDAATAHVVDMLGRTVMEADLETGRTIFDVRELPAGVYFVVARSSGRVVARTVWVKL